MGNVQVKEDESDLLKSLKDQKTVFTINGQPYKVGAEVGDMSLNTFIRETANLKGTKFMCLEGGCGACIVAVNFTHPATFKRVTYGVNSCLIRVLSCHGFEITTIEGIGNKYKGYHEIQRRLAAANGSQCGYCSPGMVMNMYSLLQQNAKPTMEDIENSFGGNICRCTGYRPILDAFKSFGVDAPKELKDKVGDIEDLGNRKNGFSCAGRCDSCEEICAEKVDFMQPTLYEFRDGSQWFRPSSVDEIHQILDLIDGKTYRFVAGYTGHGVYRVIPKPQVYIDINGVSELHTSSVSSTGITLGANMSITETMALLYQVARERPAVYAYCRNLADHMDLVASVPVRNIGTLAGNLFLKHQYNEFQSDIFLLLETVGATVVIREPNGIVNRMSLLEFLATSMDKKVMTQILLPILNSQEYIVTTYKITPRHQNAHAIVNAGFRFRVQKSGKFKVLDRPCIVYGGIARNFVHANKAEEFLNGKSLLFTPTLNNALDVLSSEIFPEIAPPEPSPEYRKNLALSLFYKFVLSLAPDSISPQYRSGGSILERPLSSGRQDFDTRKEVWPLNQPVRKIEGMIQSAGEAEYTSDIPHFPGQLWGQLVLCNRAKTEILSIDASAALKLEGVVAFFEAKDIPGENTFCPPRTMFYDMPERVFASGKTDFAGQAVGIIVAESFELATEASMMVKINYGKTDPDVMYDARKIIADNVTSRITEINRLEPTAKKDNVRYKVKGEFKVPDQYHYYMELLSCVSVPTEDKLDIYPSSQWPGVLQDTVGLALNMPEHKINVQVRRLGGGYGGKITLPTHTAVACSLAAVKLHKPVRLVVQLERGMNFGGKRDPVFAYYEAGVDENGVIQHLDMKIYQDEGFANNDSPMILTFLHLPNCYDVSTWSVVGYGVKTDLPSNTWCRAPGSLEGCIISENLMEHIAHVVNRPSHEVRIANMPPNHAVIQLVAEIRQSTDFENRQNQIKTFNQNNRWKKRGISLVTMDYPYHYFGPFHGSVTIYRFDGTVSIGHGAIEMGQGCNTKAAQVAAYMLGIELDKVSVQPVNNFVSPNNFVTGASLGSESVAFAVMKSCEELNQRLQPVKDKLGPNAKWLDIITEAYTQHINLRAAYKFIPTDAQSYQIYGTSVTEVEVDILTGQYEILRVDLIEDTGESLSPEIDIGQVEGAMIMGFGLFTTEELVYNNNGNLLTDRTWTYKPPGAKDIPQDFRVTLRKNSSNPFGVLRSKATGEPPFCISVSVAFAIREAMESARHDTGNDEWPTILLPYTREKMWLGSLTTKEMFKL